MFLRPFFDRISENAKQYSDREDLVESIKQEVVWLIKTRTCNLPLSFSSYDLRKWEISMAQQIREHETRLLRPHINVVDITSSKVRLELTGILAADSEQICFEIAY